METTNTALSAEHTQYLALYSDHIPLTNMEDKISFIEQWQRLQCWIDSESEKGEFSEDVLPLKNDLSQLSSDNDSGLDDEFFALLKCLDRNSDKPFVWHIFRAVNAGNLPKTFEHFLTCWLDKQKLPLFPFTKDECIDEIGLNTKLTQSMTIEYALDNPKSPESIYHVINSDMLKDALGFCTKDALDNFVAGFQDQPPVDRHIQLWWNVCLSHYPDVNAVIKSLDVAKADLHSKKLALKEEPCFSISHPKLQPLFTAFFPGEQYQFAELYNASPNDDAIGVLFAWLIHGAEDLGYQIKSLASSGEKSKEDLIKLIAWFYDELCTARDVSPDDLEYIKTTVNDLIKDFLPILRQDKIDWMKPFIAGDEVICHEIIDSSDELQSTEVLSELLRINNTTLARETSWNLLRSFRVSSPDLLAWLADEWDALPVKSLVSTDKGRELLRSSSSLSDRLSAIAELLGETEASTAEEHDPNKLRLESLTQLDWESFRDVIHRWVILNSFATLDEVDFIAQRLIADASEEVWKNMAMSGEQEYTAKRIRKAFENKYRDNPFAFPSRYTLKSAISEFVDDPEKVVRMLDQSSDEVLPGLLQGLLCDLAHQDSHVEQRSLCLRVIKGIYPDYSQVWTRQIVKCLDKHMETMNHKWVRAYCLCLGFLREPWGNKVPKILARVGSYDAFPAEIREVAKQQRKLFNRENLPKGQGRSRKRRVEDVKSCIVLTASTLRS